MPLLCYWQPDIFRHDRDEGFSFHLNQNSPAMLRARPGDSLWAFTRNVGGEYVLAAELLIRARTRNRLGYRYGAHRLWADMRHSRQFDIDAGSDAEWVIRSLSIPTHALRLGQSFQGSAAVREISEVDHQRIAAFAPLLPTLRASLGLREEELEERVARGWLIREPGTAVYRSRRAQAVASILRQRRAREHVVRLQRTYRGRCQVCRYDPRARYAVNICHGHHIVWLSRGGEDELANLCLLCPNHHAAVHRADAAFDFEGLRFLFPNGRIETIALNDHLESVTLA